MADAVGQAEVGKEGKGPAGMTCLVYKGSYTHLIILVAIGGESKKGRDKSKRYC